MNVTYCRSAAPSYHNIQNQIDICSEFLETKGVQVDAVYVDDGIPAYEKMGPEIQKIKSNIGDIDSITVTNPDRLCRNAMILTKFLKYLEKNNVTLYFLQI